MNRNCLIQHLLGSSFRVFLSPRMKSGKCWTIFALFAAIRARAIAFFNILICLCCVLLLQVGCQEQAGVAEKPQTIPTAPEPVVAQPEEAETAPQIAKPAPKITFEKVVHDFGDVGPGTRNTGEFKFTNTGDSSLEILKVERCCGVVTTLSKEEYAPGESGVLKVEYGATYQPGLMRRQIYVNSNDKATPRVTLTIKAEIVRKISSEPEKLKLFLDEENAGCPKITLTSLDNQPFSITAFKSTAGCITAEIDSSVEATKFVLDPRVNMEKLQRSLKGRINVSLTHPQCDVVDILFDVLPKFAVTPQRIIILDAEPQKPTLRQVSLLNNYNDDFEVESGSSKNNIIKILGQEKIRNGYQFVVEITPPAAEGKTSFTDVFVLNIKGGEKVEITCHGFYSGRTSKTQ